jgi:exopolyphosphatase/guanosine-5'-triphosphate,3'-diphosphate pyrophosphatase
MIIASIDIGTNTVLLLIANVDPIRNQIVPILNEYRLPRVGFGTRKSGVISEERLSLLDEVLFEYKYMIDEYKCEKILVTGTNAFRIAKNTADIINDLKNKFNFDLTVVSGEEEAEMAYLGAISNIKQHNSCMVIDIGGSSTEIIIGQRYQMISKVSLQLGSVSSSELFFKHSPPMKSEIEIYQSEISKLLSTIQFEVIPRSVIAIAGTATTLGCMKLGLSNYNEEEINNCSLTTNDLNKMINKLSSLSASEILNKYGAVMQGREDIILTGALTLYELMNFFNIKLVNISSRGIRYGAIIKYLRKVN